MPIPKKKGGGAAKPPPHKSEQSIKSRSIKADVNIEEDVVRDSPSEEAAIAYHVRKFEAWVANFFPVVQAALTNLPRQLKTESTKETADRKNLLQTEDEKESARAKLTISSKRRTSLGAMLLALIVFMMGLEQNRIANTLTLVGIGFWPAQVIAIPLAGAITFVVHLTINSQNFRMILITCVIFGSISMVGGAVMVWDERNTDRRLSCEMINFDVEDPAELAELCPRHDLLPEALITLLSLFNTLAVVVFAAIASALASHMLEKLFKESTDVGRLQELCAKRKRELEETQARIAKLVDELRMYQGFENDMAAQKSAMIEQIRFLRSKFLSETHRSMVPKT